MRLSEDFIIKHRSDENFMQTMEGPLKYGSDQ